MRRTTRENGAALIVALVLLVVVTLLGVTGLRNVTLEEKMAAATYDRSLAFQAAEVALREGEVVAEAQSKLRPPNQGFRTYTDADSSCPPEANNDYCTGGLCATPDKDCVPRWQDPNFLPNNWASASSVSTLAGTPEYFVEYLGCRSENASLTECTNYYRITARSDPNLGNTGRAAVVLQSVYATD